MFSIQLAQVVRLCVAAIAIVVGTAWIKNFSASSSPKPFSGTEKINMDAEYLHNPIESNSIWSQIINYAFFGVTKYSRSKAELLYLT